MKIPLPLYARIAGWFLLNLLLIAVLVFFFTRQYFNLDTLVAGPAGSRISTLAKLTGENLRSLNEEDWPGLLKSLEQQHQLGFHAFYNDGSPIAGEITDVPELVLSRLAEFKSLSGSRRHGTGRGGQGPGAWQRKGQGNRIGVESDLENGEPVRAHLLFATRDEQGNYWFASRIGMGRASGSLQRPNSATLLIQSNSLGANGLILDTDPWWRLGAAIIVLSILLWIPFTWRLSRYIRRLTSRTIRIARGNFESSEISHRGDELGRLGMAIDRLRQRLSGYVDGQKRFISDIAHELCTPLARMQLSLGVLEQQSSASSETIGDLRDEVQQMSGMVDELLNFSRAQFSPDQVPLETVALADLVRQVVEKEGATTATVDISDKLRIRTSAHLLCRALGNVIRNAMRYAPGKEILIHTLSSGDTVELLIDDAGPGIPDEHLPRIFEPFYRVDSARTREDGGTGLGLAIVSTCMEGCRGTASCENLASGGLRVILTLPAA